MDNNMATILVVDDDKDIVNAISKLLEMEGYKTIKAYDGLQAIEILMENDVQLIIIDVMMPRLDGLSAMMKIRDTQNIPIIVLSAKSEECDKIQGLSMGADDYVTKPYNPAELVARVKSNLRRYLSLGSAVNQEKLDTHILRNGGMVLNLDTKLLTVDGDNIKLTATEYKIVEFFLKNRGKVFSAEEIYQSIWEEAAYAVENTVMVHIRHIREKIEINPKEPKYIKVSWGIGYKMENL